MKPCVKMMYLLLALTLLALLSLGCVGTSSEIPKDTRIKCAKCSTSYSIEEGLSEPQGSGVGK